MVVESWDTFHDSRVLYAHIRDNQSNQHPLNQSLYIRTSLSLAVWCPGPADPSTRMLTSLTLVVRIAQIYYLSVAVKFRSSVQCLTLRYQVPLLFVIMPYRVFSNPSCGVPSTTASSTVFWPPCPRRSEVHGFAPLGLLLTD